MSRTAEEGTDELTFCDWAPASDPAATRDVHAGEMTQRAGAALLPSAVLLLCVPGEQGMSWVQGVLLWRVRVRQA